MSNWPLITRSALVICAVAVFLLGIAPSGVAQTIPNGDVLGGFTGAATNVAACSVFQNQSLPTATTADDDFPHVTQPAQATSSTGCSATQSASATITVTSVDPHGTLAAHGTLSAAADASQPGAGGVDSSDAGGDVGLEFGVPINGGTVPVQFHLDWGPPNSAPATDTPATYTLLLICNPFPCDLGGLSQGGNTLASSGTLDQTFYVPPGNAISISLYVSADVSAEANPGPAQASSSGQFNISASISAGDQGKNLGTCPCDDPALAGNPINVATGNKFQSETDYTGGPSDLLTLRRTYNSQSSASGMFGDNWTSNYDIHVRLIDSFTVQATRADGKIETFGLQLGAWQADPDVTDRLTQLASGWQLVTSDDSTETYDTAGRLVSITTRAGLITNLNYDGNGHLVSVTGPFDYQMTFSHNATGQVSQMTSPDGGTFEYAYDASGNLATVQYPDSSVKKYVYEDAAFPHALTGIIDQNGSRFATWSYDSQGRGISSQHAGGADLTTVIYNADGTAQITDANQHSHAYALGTQFGVSKPLTVTGTPCPACGAQAFSYDTLGFTSSRTDWDGNVTTYLHESRGLEIQRTEASGTPVARTTTTVWSQTFHLPVIVVKPSNEFIEYSYDGHGNLLTRSLCCSQVSGGSPFRTWTYTYDSVGHVLTAKGPRTDVNDLTTYTYDSRGNLASLSDALGHVTRYTSYDENGRLLTTVDPNGTTTTRTYDPLGRLLTRNVGGLLTSYTYDPTGLLTKVTQPDGSFVALTYDAAHRLVKVANSFGAYIVYTLDPLGNPTLVQTFDATNTLTATHSNTFDALNRVAQSIGALGQKTLYTYDNNSNLLSMTDPLGQVTQMVYDALNRRTSSTDPTSAVTAFAYDANDNLTGVTDARGLSTSYTYDGLNDRLTTQSPDTGLTQVSYDSAGNVSSQVDADGRLATSSYDALNRVTQTRYAGTTATTFSYDQGPNGIGHLTSMEDTSGSTDWTYDALGHTLSKTQSVNGVTSKVQYGYDSAGRLTTITYPSGTVVQYGYTLDLVTQISVNGTTLMSGITYQPFHGPANAWKWGNGTKYLRYFDQDQRLTQYPLGSRSRTLSFDAASRITGYTDSNPAYSQSFGYDAADRLTQYTGNSGGERYSYDALGNRTALTSTLPGASNASYGYAGSSNQLISETSASVVTPIKYDPTGNTVSDGTNQFTYDGRNRLIEASNAQGVSYYSINGLGQRVAKLAGAPLNLAGDANQDGVLNTTDLRLIALMATGAIPVNLAADCNGDGQVTTADVTCVSTKIANMRLHPQSYVASTGTEFVYDEAGHLIGEYGAAGAPIEETIYLGDMPIGVLKGGGMSYIYPDHLNAPRTITNTANTLLWDWEGAPFGSSPSNQNPSGLGNFAYNLRFPGQYYDAETGLHYNNARDYSPKAGRYLESDPVGIRSGPNTYLYVGGFPTNKVDINGTGPISGPIRQWILDRFTGWAFNKSVDSLIRQADPDLGQCQSQALADLGIDLLTATVQPEIGIASFLYDLNFEVLNPHDPWEPLEPLPSGPGDYYPPMD